MSEFPKGLALSFLGRTSKKTPYTRIYSVGIVLASKHIVISNVLNSTSLSLPITSIILYDHVILNTWDDLAKICWGRHLILQPREKDRTCTLAIIYVLFRKKADGL